LIHVNKINYCHDGDLDEQIEDIKQMLDELEYIYSSDIDDQIEISIKDLWNLNSILS